MSAVSVPVTMSAPWLVATRIEVVRLLAQARVRVLLALCALGPVLFGLAMGVQSSVPSDTLFGRWLHESGWAFALVVLGFSSQWALPAVVSVVAGDIVSAEDAHRTWTTVLTRSLRRGDVLLGKVVAVLLYVVAAVVLLAASSVLTGLVLSGSQPLVGLSGTVLGPGAAATATLAAWASVLPATLVVAALALLVSAWSRNGWVGVIVPIVVALLLQLLGQLSAVDPVRELLPTAGFDAWHGLPRTDRYLTPVWQSAACALVWVLALLAATGWLVVRRDVTEA